MGKIKVSQEDIIKALENKGKTESYNSVAKKLGYADVTGLTRRLKKMASKIQDYSKGMAMRFAIDALKNLAVMAKTNPRASHILLEIAGIYVPKLEDPGKERPKDTYTFYPYVAGSPDGKMPVGSPVPDEIKKIHKERMEQLKNA